MLGDHLSEKSDTVKWIDVSMPHRSRRLKDHKVLQEIAENDPDTEEIFLDNLLDTYYPQRPDSLEDVCLHDFVANYDWQSKDSRGNRMYKKLQKPRLPNHKLFDPENENQREDYYYSLILLFTPFREESSLLLESETAEEAFHRLVSIDSSAYHAKLKRMLEAQSTSRRFILYTCIQYSLCRNIFHCSNAQHAAQKIVSSPCTECFLFQKKNQPFWAVLSLRSAPGSTSCNLGSKFHNHMSWGELTYIQHIHQFSTCMWMQNLDADRSAMYFCVAAACLFELMFIVRAPGLGHG